MDQFCDDCTKKDVDCFEFRTKPAAFCKDYTRKEKDTNPGGAFRMRKFEGGATRDTATGKLSYVKALSPIVLERYVQYLSDHRKLPDGSLRDFDNWKKGIPDDVYLDGLQRHLIAAWMIYDGFPAFDNHGLVDLEESLAAIIFNASGWLHELIKEKRAAAEE